MENLLTLCQTIGANVIVGNAIQGDRKVQYVKANHLEPGLVRYEGMGENGRDLVLLLPKETIDKMRSRFEGSVVVNGKHRDVDSTAFSRGDADGAVIESFWDGTLGKEMVKYMVWTQDAKNNVAKSDWGVSCSYNVTKRDMTPGMHNNIPYDGVILDGEYNHLAIVPNPRYEDSRNTLLNDKGGKSMLKVWLEKLGIKNSVEVDGDKSSVTLKDGKSITLKALMENSMKVEAAKNPGESLADSVEVELPNGKKKTVGEMKAELENAGNCGASCGKHNSASEHDKAVAAEKLHNDKKMEDEEDEKKKKAQNEKDEEDEKKKKEAKNAEEEEEKKKKAENAKKEVETKLANEKAKALEDAARKRESNDQLHNGLPYITEGAALERGRELFGSDPAAR